MEKQRCTKKGAGYGRTILLGLVLLALMAGTALGSEGISVFVDNQEIDYGDSPPMVINERVMVGVRSLALALGVPEENILWDGPSQTVMLTKVDTVIILAIGNSNMIVNDSYVQMDTTPAISNERIYLPARYVSEALGYEVGWDGPNNAVLISSTGTPAVNNNSNNNNATNGDAVNLIGGWSNLAYSPTGSMVDPATGFIQGSYSSGEWYYFNSDRSFRHVLIGKGSIISGMSEIYGNYQVQGNQILFTNQVESFTPYPNDTIHPPEYDQPADDETVTFVYRSEYDTITIDGWNTFDRIQ